MTAATPRGQPALKKKPQDSPRTDGRLATLLKWIGAISAVISLLVGLNQVTWCRSFESTTKNSRKQ